MKFVDQGFGVVKMTPETERDIASLREQFPHLWPFESVCTVEKYAFKITLQELLFRG